MIVDTYKLESTIALPGGARVLDIIIDEMLLVVEYPEPGNGKKDAHFVFRSRGESYLGGKYLGYVPDRGFLFRVPS